MALTEPLDLEYWLINVLAGSVDIFIFVALVVITFLSARFKMSLGVYFIILSIFALIMKGIGVSYLIVLLVLAGSGVLFSIIKRMVD